MFKEINIADVKAVGDLIYIMVKEYGVICLKVKDLLQQTIYEETFKKDGLVWHVDRTFMEEQSVRVLNGMKFAVHDDKVMILVFKHTQGINTMVELNFYALEGKT